LQAGEPIVIDMGARLNGYCSDLTRTFCLGQPNEPERFWEVYNTVLRAQTAAEAALRPGITGQAGDAVARDLITAAGYGDAFGHGLGHGIGLAVHEEPRLSRTNLSPLAAGSLVTVEPGIYLPGWGGVRIEDVVLITDSGVEVLTRAPKEPILPG
jgi:Xaa-Pro aminopeptidase